MISAKEKAAQLVDRFKPLVTTWDCYWDTPRDAKDILEDAKKCAIICVNEILDSYPHTFDLSEYTTKEGLIHISIENVRSNMGYWQEVKNEIEKL